MIDGHPTPAVGGTNYMGFTLPMHTEPPCPKGYVGHAPDPSARNGIPYTSPRQSMCVLQDFLYRVRTLYRYRVCMWVCIVCGITLMQHWSTECACMPISSRHFIIGNRKEQHIQLYRSKVKLINRLRLVREFWKAANVSHKPAGVNTGILPEKRWICKHLVWVALELQRPIKNTHKHIFFC
jgi:hypothetical protein